MISYDTYYIGFYKNQPLKKEDLPKDYEVTSENTFTGEVKKSKPLDYEIEKFDFSELPKFEINNQETKIFEVLNNSLFASIEANNIDGMTIYFSFDVEGIKEDYFNNRMGNSQETIIVNITRKETEKILRFAFPLNSFFLKNFNDIIYFQLTSFSKSKLIKINLAQNENYNLFKKKSFEFINKYKFLDKYPLGYKKEILDVINLYNRFTNDKILQSSKFLSKKKILQISWVTAVLTSYEALFLKKSQVGEVSLNTNGIEKYEFWKTHILNIFKFEGDKILSRHYMSEFLDDLSKKTKIELSKILMLRNIYFHSKDFVKEIETDPIFQSLGAPITRLYILLYETDFGLKLPNGQDIDFDDFEFGDLFLYWLGVSNRVLFDLFLGEANFFMNYWKPAVIKDDKMFNQNFTPGNAWYAFEFSSIDNDKVLDDNLEKILNEAINNKIYTIPYGAIVEIDDPIFRFIQIFEDKDKIKFLVFDKDSRFLYEELDLNTQRFQNFIFNFNTFRDKDETSKFNHRKNFYTIFTTLVRDFWTVIERERNLGPIRQKFLNKHEERINKKRIIYLQRIRYKGPQNTSEINKELKMLSNSKGGWRTHSVMKLREGFKPSPLQILLAQKCGVVVPDGHTFKKAHAWGRKDRSEAEVTYRSRNLTGMFFLSKQTIEKAEEIISMSPLKFEEFCHEYVLKNGWNETVTRVTDDGIDIEAYKQLSEGKIIRLFAQCKHHKRNINKEVIRELIGAKVIEDKDYETELMVITSGKFASGAIEIANKQNVKLVDGSELLNSM